MPDEQPCKTNGVAVTNLTEFLLVAAQQIWPINEDQPESPRSYHVALGREPIQLGIVEFRILLFLASRPYHAFTRRCIADAVNSKRDPVSENTVAGTLPSCLTSWEYFTTTSSPCHTSATASSLKECGLRARVLLGCCRTVSLRVD